MHSTDQRWPLPPTNSMHGGYAWLYVSVKRSLTVSISTSTLFYAAHCYCCCYCCSDNEARSHTHVTTPLPPYNYNVHYTQHQPHPQHQLHHLRHLRHWCHCDSQCCCCCAETWRVEGHLVTSPLTQPTHAACGVPCAWQACHYPPRPRPPPCLAECQQQWLAWAPLVAARQQHDTPPCAPVRVLGPAWAVSRALGGSSALTQCGDR